MLCCQRHFADLLCHQFIILSLHSFFVVEFGLIATFPFDVAHAKLKHFST
jgi:hypothetical protein